MADSYRTVTCKVAAVRPKAIEVIIDNRKGTYWIPRSLLHYADDRVMDELIPVVEHTFRVREFKAEELGLA